MKQEYRQPHRKVWNRHHEKIGDKITAQAARVVHEVTEWFEESPGEKTFMIAAGVTGVALLGTGVGLAAAGHEAALMAVASSNLSMVMALTGAALLVFTSMSVYQIWHKKMPVPARFVIPSIIGLIIGGISYAGVHIGIASTLPASLSIAESLATQGAISFGIGAALAAILCGIGYKVGKELNAPDEALPTIPRTTAMAAVGGLICAASTTLGPALSACMGVSAANTAEAVSMEAMLALAITSLTLTICVSVYLAIEGKQSKQGAYLVTYSDD